MPNIEKAPSKAVEKKPEAKVSLLTYKIALPTDDGQFIAGHFGRANYFLVAEIQGKQIINTELRTNDSHKDHPHHHHEHNHHHDHNHEHDKSAHQRIFQILDDVDIIIASHMGPRIKNELLANSYTVILTKISNIQDAIKAYLKGHLQPIND